MSERLIIGKITKIGFRVPDHNDLYINKFGKLQTQKGIPTSRRAKKKIIVKYEAYC